MLKIIQKNLIYFIILVIVGGLLNVHFFGGLKFTPLICLLAALVMIYPSLVPLSFSGLKKLKHHHLILGLSVILNFIIAPTVAYFVSGFFLPNEPVLRLGFIILSLLPGGGMVTTWALKSKADMVVTVGVILLNLVLAIGLTPFGISYATKLLAVDNKPVENVSTQLSLNKNVSDNATLKLKTEASSGEGCAIEKATKGKASCSLGSGSITPFKIAIPIIFIIIFPLTLAWITQRVIIKFKGEKHLQGIKKKFGAFSNLGLLIVLFILMSLENNAMLFEQAHLIWRVLLGLFVFYGITFTIPYILYKKFFHNAEGKALLWGSYLRYITLALGLAISLIFQNENLAPVVLVIVLSYFIQIPSSYWIAKKL